MYLIKLIKMKNKILNNPLLSLNISILCRSQLLLPVLFLFYQQNGLTAGDFFLFEGISSFISLLLIIPSGYIADFFSKKYVLLLSFLLLLIKSFLWIFFHGYYIILLGTILNNVSKSLYFATADSYIYEYLSYNKREKEMLNKYGKMNFYFSLGIAITSIFSSICYSYFGSLVLLIIDFLLSSIATFLIFLMPNLPVAHKKNKKSLKYRIIEMYVIVKNVLKNKKINKLFFLCGIFGTTTLISSNSFQPIMKISLVPVSLFGIVFFVNYLLRSLSGIFVNKFQKLFSLQKASYVVFLTFILSLLLLSFSSIILNKYFVLFSIFVTCCAISFEVMFNIESITYIHKKILFKRRSATSSIIFAITKLFSSIFLSSFKFTLSHLSISFSIFLYIIIFITIFYIINRNFIIKNLDN